MNEKELEALKMKTQEITQGERKDNPDPAPKAVAFNLEKDPEKKSVKSHKSKLRYYITMEHSGSIASYVTELEKQLNEERSAREKLANELDEIKKLVNILTKSMNSKA